MKRILLIALVCGGLLGGCGVASQPTTQSEVLDNTELTGVVRVEGDVATLKQANGTTSLDSYGVDLKKYDGKSVTVSGQYSGETLFVDEVKAE